MKLCFPNNMQPVVLLEWDWIVMRNIFLLSRSKPSKVGTEHIWSSVFPEKKFLLCIQIKGLVLTQTVVLAQLKDFWAVKEEKGR